MSGEEFEIKIDPSGKVTVRTHGIKGERCLDYADLFAQIIGQEQARQLTAEYHEVDTAVDEHIHQKLKR